MPCVSEKCDEDLMICLLLAGETPGRIDDFSSTRPAIEAPLAQPQARERRRHGLARRADEDGVEARFPDARALVTEDERARAKVLVGVGDDEPRARPPALVD